MGLLWLQGGFDLSGFFEGLGQVLASVYNFIVQAIIFLVNLIIQVFVFLFNLLVLIFKFFFEGFKLVGKFFHAIYDVVIKRGLLHIFDWLAKLRAKLEQWLGPVLKWLRRIRAWYQEFFKRWVLPVINAIQHIRQFLAILKLFHIKWAAALDHELALIQDKITKNFLRVVQEINKIISWVSLIIDVDGLLRRIPLLNSIFKALTDFRRLTFGANLTADVPGSDVSGTFPDRNLLTQPALVSGQEANATGDTWLTDAAGFAVDVFESYGEPPDDFLGFTG